MMYVEIIESAIGIQVADYGHAHYLSFSHFHQVVLPIFIVKPLIPSTN